MNTLKSMVGMARHQHPPFTIQLNDDEFAQLEKVMLIRNPTEELPNIYWFYGEFLKDLALEKIKEVLSNGN